MQISGSGNVAQYAAEKVLELGGVVISFSDSNGSLSSAEGEAEKTEKKEKTDIPNSDR